MNKINIGMIGAGQIANYHLERYQKIPDAKITAIADIKEAKAEKAGKKFDIDYTYKDYKNILQDAEIDAVDVCLHNNLHAPVTIDSLEAGKDVFCEKPMAGSYADALRMYRKAQEENKNLTIQNNRLYDKETKAARKLIEDGNLGRVFLGRVAHFQGVGIRRRSIPYVEGYGSMGFVKKEFAGGGALYDLATYSIGQVMHLLDAPEVKRVSGKTYQNAKERYESSSAESPYSQRLEKSEYDIEDLGCGFVRLNDEKIMTVTSGWHAYIDPEGSSVLGTKGGIRLDPFKFYTTISDMEADATLDLEEYERRKGLMEGRSEGVESEIQYDSLYHWVQTLKGEKKPLPTAEIALKSMMIMEGIYLSNKLGKELSSEEIKEKSESTALNV
ncbi:MAG: Gfo/Idh/MocA family protein [Candidatus Hadarchaeota archaeon]